MDDRFRDIITAQQLVAINNQDNEELGKLFIDGAKRRMVTFYNASKNYVGRYGNAARPKIMQLWNHVLSEMQAEWLAFKQLCTSSRLLAQHTMTSVLPSFVTSTSIATGVLLKNQTEKVWEDFKEYIVHRRMNGYSIIDRLIIERIPLQYRLEVYHVVYIFKAFVQYKEDDGTIILKLEDYHSEKFPPTRKMKLIRKKGYPFLRLIESNDMRLYREFDVPLPFLQEKEKNTIRLEELCIQLVRKVYAENQEDLASIPLEGPVKDMVLRIKSN